MTQHVAAVLLLLVWSPGAVAQFFATCYSASEYELQRSMADHEEHMYRLNRKFLDNYYYQKKNLPKDFVPASLDSVKAYLQALKPRNAAVLFYAAQGDRFCSWLISPDSPVVGHVEDVSLTDLEGLHAELVDALGVAGMASNRAPTRRGVQPAEPAPGPHHGSQDLDRLLEEAAELLIPGPIDQDLEQQHIDTLIVVPIGSLSTLPYAALPSRDGSLINRFSLTVAPGFFAFKDPPAAASINLEDALIVGDPVGVDPKNKWTFPPLPGARLEATEVAQLLEVEPLIGEAATHKAVVDRIRAHPDLGLVYLATHGVADRSNPRDASFLLLSGSRWPASEIQNLPFTNDPLVVLSACQTGLGKDFEVGTIGMTRAWHRAGSKRVVMSLWNVDDASTHRLMFDFVGGLHELPVEEALRAAMLSARERNPHPAYWAGFTVFGLPQAR